MFIDGIENVDFVDVDIHINADVHLDVSFVDVDTLIRMLVSSC